MIHFLRESVAGRLAWDVAAGIKCRPYLDSLLTTRMVKLVTARSLGNCVASEFPVGNLKSREREIHVPVGNLKIDNTCCRRKQIDFPDYFTMIKAQMKHHHKKIIYSPMAHRKKKRTFGPVFTGDVEKRYLEYLDNFDNWKSLLDHVSDYPRRRSENEKRLIFEKWAAHVGRKYPSAELKEMRFAQFKKSLAFIDESNSNFGGARLGLVGDCLDAVDDRVFLVRWDGGMKMDDTGCQRKIYFPSFFTKMKAQKKAADPHKKRIFGPVFTGEVEKRYLEYLKKLDWDSVHKHITDFPRRRSDDEKRVIFDKWVAHYGKEYRSVDRRLSLFNESLDYIDNANSKHQEGFTLRLDSTADIMNEKFRLDTADGISIYWVKGFSKPCSSSTPPDFCELSGTVDHLYFNSDDDVEVCFPF